MLIIQLVVYYKLFVSHSKKTLVRLSSQCLEKYQHVIKAQNH